METKKKSGPSQHAVVYHFKELSIFFPKIFEKDFIIHLLKCKNTIFKRYTPALVFRTHTIVIAVSWWSKMFVQVLPFKMTLLTMQTKQKFVAIFRRHLFRVFLLVTFHFFESILFRSKKKVHMIQEINNLIY